MLRLRCSLFAAILLNIVVAAEAQIIRGKLLDDRTDAPIAAGAVTMRTQAFSVRTVLTDSAGRFRFHVPRPGYYLLEGSGLGYLKVKSPVVAILGNDTVDVELRLATDAVPLAPLTITARRSTRARLLDDFEQRRKKGFGQFLGPEDIKRLSPFHVTDLLREMRGIIMHADRTQVDLTMRAMLGGRCVPHIVVDGVAVSENIPINEFLSASSIRAVEVYTLASDVPAEFASVIRRGCGAVVLWTSMAIAQ